MLKQFFEVDLELNPELHGIVIERAHRFGRKTRNRFSKRPIIAAFNNYSDTVKILNSARLLRGTQFSVDRYYPAEITNARKLLWPRYKALKQNKRERDTVESQYPARLVKNNVVIEDAFPGWTDVMKGTRVIPSVRNRNTPNEQPSNRSTASYQQPAKLSQDNQQESAGDQSSRPRGHRIEELTWDKQPPYEMGAQSGGWGSEPPQRMDSSSRSERRPERLSYLKFQLKSQRQALKQL